MQSSSKRNQTAADSTTKKRARGGRGALSVLLFVAAAVLLFEEWFWDRSTAFAARLGRLPIISAIETWIRRRSRWQALALFVLPIVVIYPLKAVALYSMTHASMSLGVATFVVAKLIATAVFARLYQLTEPAITKIGWVLRGRNAFLRWRAFMHAWLNAQPAYRKARDMIRARSVQVKLQYRAAYRLRRKRRRARNLTANTAGSTGLRNRGARSAARRRAPGAH